MKKLLLIIYCCVSLDAQTSKFLLNWKAALGNSRGAISNARIAFVGDSTTMGYGGTNEGSQSWKDSWVTRFSGILTTNGISSTVGLGVPPTNISDTRWSVGTGWTIFSGAGVVNAYTSSGGSGGLTYTPGISSNVYDVWYVGQNNLGTNCTAQATGGSAVVMNPSLLSSGVYKVTVTAASVSTSNVVTITAVTGSCFILGVEPYLSATNQVISAFFAAGGLTTAEFISPNLPTFNGLSFLKAYQPSLTVISLGINDCEGSIDPSLFVQNVSQIVNAAISVNSDVIIASMPPSQSGYVYACEANLESRLQTLANQYNVPFFDTFSVMSGGWASPIMSDTYHPNEAGYFEWGQKFYNFLLTR